MVGGGKGSGLEDRPSKTRPAGGGPGCRSLQADSLIPSSTGGKGEGGRGSQGGESGICQVNRRRHWNPRDARG